jgi:hypothetical protein
LALSLLYPFLFFPLFFRFILLFSAYGVFTSYLFGNQLFLIFQIENFRFFHYWNFSASNFYNVSNMPVQIFSLGFLVGKCPMPGFFEKVGLFLCKCLMVNKNIGLFNALFCEKMSGLVREWTFCIVPILIDK